MAIADVSREKTIQQLCEHSRFLRLDHSFNSNMLDAIVTSISKLNVKDPRIIYQVVHWLEKRAIQMHPPQMYNVICLLDKMEIYHEKAWKALGWFFIL